MNPALSITSLSFSYGNKSVLDNVSLQVEKGFCALLGPNGAGKTTLFSILSGMIACPEGKILFRGIDIGQAPRKILTMTGVVFQEETLEANLSVRKNLEYFGALRGMWGRELRSKIEEKLELMDVRSVERTIVRDLNTGHRRRVEIARALIHDPTFMLLDEPTVGLDIKSRHNLTAHIHEMAKDRGLTVVWATHLIDEISDDDHLVIIHSGKILKSGKAAEVRGDQDLKSCFLSLTGQE